jgi:hypothetical protein
VVFIHTVLDQFAAIWSAVVIPTVPDRLKQHVHEEANQSRVDCKDASQHYVFLDQTLCNVLGNTSNH